MPGHPGHRRGERDRGDEPEGEHARVAPGQRRASPPYIELAQRVDRVAHRQHVVQRRERAGQRLPGERAAGGDQLHDHEHQAEELADAAEQRVQQQEDRREGAAVSASSPIVPSGWATWKPSGPATIG